MVYGKTAFLEFFSWTKSFVNGAKNNYKTGISMRNNFLILVFAISAHFFLFTDEVRALEGYRVSVEPAVLKIPAGKEGVVVITIRIPRGYHIYGNPVGPGTGKPTTVSIKNLPGVIESGTVRYPKAKRYFEPGDTGHVWIYEGEVHLFLPVKAKKEARSGKFAFDLIVDALVCGKGTCIPIEKTIHKSLTILPPDGIPSSISPEMDALFSAAKEPLNAENNFAVRGSLMPNEVEITYNFQPRFLDSVTVGNIIQAIIFGILAGFILNFMPCVLPVVSLKVMSFVSHGGEDRKKIFLSGLFFSLGIIVVFLVLALLAAFFGYGWGELFTQKEFLILMTSLVFALALSLFDVFTLTPSVSLRKSNATAKNVYLQSFGKGMVATFLATPCSGPFLGGTLAWTMMQSPMVIFTIFTCVGIGMAFPYLVLSAWPSLLKIVPKPGEWTIVFERIMGFFLLATVVYLLGIMETRDIIPMLWFLVFVLAGCWQYGKYGSPVNQKHVRYASLVVAIALVVAGYLLSFKVNWGASVNDCKAVSRPFTFERIVENSQSGKISIVQFTADWCPNCKLVERTSLCTNNVMKTLKEHNAEILVADITRRNFEAEALMAKLGNRSIPFLAVFPPGMNFTRPFCLRDMYSEESVIFAVKQAGQSSMELKIQHNNLKK